MQSTQWFPVQAKQEKSIAFRFRTWLVQLPFRMRVKWYVFRWKLMASPKEREALAEKQTAHRDRELGLSLRTSQAHNELTRVLGDDIKLIDHGIQPQRDGMGIDYDAYVTELRAIHPISGLLYQRFSKVSVHSVSKRTTEGKIFARLMRDTEAAQSLREELAK